MTTADGNVIGYTILVNHGIPAHRWDLVIMGDGYRQSELGNFSTHAQDFMDRLRNARPFNLLWNCINVYRVDISSTDSGADDPTACGGSGAVARTYLDSTFCSGGINRRSLRSNSTTAIAVANRLIPQWNAILVIVNSTIDGGTGGSVGTFSINSNESGLHELGHIAFRLGDEYEYRRGCASNEITQNSFTGSEPSWANVTANIDRNTIKWRHLINAATPIPTTSNANCAQCDTQANPLAAGTVGAFEGANTFHCGAFRPEFNCKMRTLNIEFCSVCQQKIRNVLSPYAVNFQLGIFHAPTGYAIPNGQWMMGDFDGDGRDDIVHAVAGTNYIHTWRSNGDGTFTIGAFHAPPDYLIPNGQWMMGDLDGDGRDDIVHAVAGTNYIHTWYSLGNGTFDIGTFHAPTGYAIPNGQWMMGDFNGDGRDDIVHAVAGTNYIHTWNNIGSGTFDIGTFHAPAGYNPNGQWMMGDFDGNGIDDIVHAVARERHIHPWLSNGDGTFNIGRIGDSLTFIGYTPNEQWMMGRLERSGRDSVFHAVNGTNYVHTWRSR